MAASSTDEMFVYTVTVLKMNGESCTLPPLQESDTVQDMARSIRCLLGIPMSVQQLAWGSHVLQTSEKSLGSIFGNEKEIEVFMARKPFSSAERAELHRRLVRATAAGAKAAVRELLREGAQVEFEVSAPDTDKSVSLSHWDESQTEESKDGSLEQVVGDPTGNPQDVVVGEQRMEGISAPASEVSMNEMEDEEATRGEAAKVEASPCGGISPLLMALAGGHDELARDFRLLGAREVDLIPMATSCLNEAFHRQDFPEIVKHLANGADRNTRLGRGHGVKWALREWAIWPGRAETFGTPLHALAAMHSLPGAYETAQLLIQMKADLDAPDAEGDTPLAHARYFRAPDMYYLYKGQGAQLAGPFYAGRIDH
eukprot:TRINITY_DN50729_c0_g1_i1.p1 TRINITY_DN50729_c0_g1~~TRINITY_DN50729_c0_g1_i1.p1  ORF type:complete len:370 (-),score=88.41 TRINITY_DN50729_c0_g1_i1:115-1224(-)